MTIAIGLAFGFGLGFMIAAILANSSKDDCANYLHVKPGEIRDSLRSTAREAWDASASVELETSFEGWWASRSEEGREDIERILKDAGP